MRHMLTAVIVSTALIQGCTTAPSTAQTSASGADQFSSYISSSDGGKGVRTGGGDCLHSGGLSSKNITLDCAPVVAVAEPAPPSAPKSAPRQQLNLSYDGTALFAFNSSQLTPEGRRELGGLVSKLNNNPRLSRVGGISVVGHADSVGTNEYNQSLSLRRAAAVRQFLRASLDNVEVVTKGMGETSPVADNSTPEGRQQNRRVEVKIDTVQTTQ